SDNELHPLHPRGDPNDPLSSMAYLEKVRGFERYLQEKAESQIRAAVGEGKAAVRVSVELDLTQKEKQSETPIDAKALVKKVTSNDSSGAPAKSGGDTSVAATPPAAKPEPAATAAAPAGESHSASEEEYRQGVTRELQVTGAGSIRHMSVSLLLDESDASLKDNTTKLGDIVKAAVGFVEGKPRSDTFTVTTLPFAKPAEPPK